MNVLNKITGLLCFSLLAAVFGPLEQAQELIPQNSEIAHNKGLLIQLDRKKIRAFEPVYLCLTAQQFVPGAEADIQMTHGGVSQPVTVAAKDWVKSEIPGNVSILRRGIVLQAREKNGVRSFLFNEAGEYTLRVTIGPDSTSLDLTVTPPEAGEEIAWQALGDKIDDVLQNNFPDPPEQPTIDACARTIRKYPRTLCAAYCQSYISIAKFKILYEKNAKAGGKAVYGLITDELQKVADAFHEGFFGEMTAFYAAYSKGLTGDFPGMLAIADSMKTHMTPWSEGVMEMRAEVQSHIAPRMVTVDPSNPLPSPENPSNIPRKSTTDK